MKNQIQKSCRLLVLVALVLLLRTTSASCQSAFLDFPVPGYEPYGNNLISSVFDHHIAGGSTNSIYDAQEYDVDYIVAAYTGEEGRQAYGVDPGFSKSYKNQYGTAFNLDGNHYYTGTSSQVYLAYDGHPAGLGAWHL